MIRLSDDLYRTDPERPFGNEVMSCAYLLIRNDGNILIYSSGVLKSRESEIRELGGIRYQYLNHRDEASEHCRWARETFDAPLACHEKEKPAVEAHCPVDATFSGETELHTDLLAIPTPGHCPGSTCYLWQGADRRYLFTGDTLYLADGQLRVYVSRGTDAEMTDSLRRIAGLEFDILVPGLYIGDTAHARVARPSFERQIDAVIERLARGEIH